MNRTRKQSGATLIVSLVMLAVLTLLVVSAIRSASSNLNITRNAQAQGEVSAAAQQATEQVIGTNFTSAPQAQTITVDMGPASYDVNVAKPVCGNTVAIMSTDPQINPTDPNDQLCIGDSPPPVQWDANGKPIPFPTKCNQQQWEIQATVNDPNTGAQTTQIQGLNKRIYLPTPC